MERDVSCAFTFDRLSICLFHVVWYIIYARLQETCRPVRTANALARQGGCAGLILVSLAVLGIKPFLAVGLKVRLHYYVLCEIKFTNLWQNNIHLGVKGHNAFMFKSVLLSLMTASVANINNLS